MTATSDAKNRPLPSEAEVEERARELFDQAPKKRTKGGWNIHREAFMRRARDLLYTERHRAAKKPSRPKRLRETLHAIAETRVLLDDLSRVAAAAFARAASDVDAGISAAPIDGRVTVKSNVHDHAVADRAASTADAAASGKDTLDEIAAAEREIVFRARDARDAVNAAVAAANRLQALDAKKARELVEDESGSTWCAACGDPILPGQNRRGRCDACRTYAKNHNGADPTPEVLEARRAIREKREGAA